MFTKRFWRDTAERVIASAAGGALTPLVLDGVNVLDHPNWKTYVGAAATTGLVSFLKAIVASRTGDSQSASLADLDDEPGAHSIA